ncbi:MAG: Regulatory sensor-transducer, BlaR1/MecR1 family / TonB-dependent receptor [uncultured Cytophagales bacterium]|uniref:Regulatory sensor-transducer, BlaR1/MecR1 family / TonB-dependent receptor n=1 Tax=uncultured Cytophagales bacterium TaxID=158755 RepID=A0A6J4LI61_9SPHI|nr:MAG: Regulatory sensor-transducer, BlaR1/MecR1 family / TonB-dependent receptor [uncultured Cytophagales bacterium]
MSLLVTYFLPANVALVLFCVAYRLVLRRLTFYGLNRLFLAFGIVFSVAYPAVDLSGWHRQYPGPNLSRLVAAAQPAPPAAAGTAEPIDYASLLGVVFWAGVAVMAGRLVVRLLALYRVHRRSAAARSGPYAFRRVAGKVAPFSFWQTIYLNPDCHNPADLPAILQHERVHVREWHTLDLLLAELVLIAGWFNPAAWALKRAVAENLEFRTDHRVLGDGTDRRTYQYSLLSISHSGPVPALANHFNAITLKTRIAMMNKPQTARRHVTRYALLLPLVVALAFMTTLVFGQNTPAAAHSAEPSQSLSFDDDSRVVYYLDGQPTEKALVDKLDAADLEKIEVFKHERVAAVLGDPQAEGLIVVTTKKNKDSAAVRALNEKIKNL